MDVSIFNSFRIGNNHLGKAVFAARSFAPRDVITQFTGDMMSKEKVPKSYEGNNDRYFQVGINRFMGASNSVDDLMNHSCDPNGGIKFTPYGIFLIALKDIKIGDEITWDYSTTMYKNDWVMNCRCGSEKCRKKIGEFLKIPKRRQNFYINRGVVAPYILKAIKKAQEDNTKQNYRTHSTKWGRKKSNAMLSLVR